MLFYKYCAPEGIAILRDRSIQLSDPRTFGDPFEPGARSLVLSLSARRDSIPMWQQYAASHTGLVIGFDAMQGLFAGDSPFSYRLAPVVYTPVRTALTAEQALLTRPEDWEHEDEWRIVASVAAADGEAVVVTPVPSRQFPIHPGSVHEVILGCRADERLDMEVVALLATPEFQHVRLCDAIPDPQHFALRMVDRGRVAWRP